MRFPALPASIFALMLALCGCSALDRVAGYQEPSPTPEAACLPPAEFDSRIVGIEPSKVRLNSDGVVSEVEGDNALDLGALLLNGACVKIMLPGYGSGSAWRRFDPKDITHVAFAKQYLKLGPGWSKRAEGNPK